MKLCVEEGRGETIWARWPLVKRWRRRVVGRAYRVADLGWFGMVPLERHVVICGYPRAGTTLLLAMMEHALPGARRFGGEVSAWRAATYVWRNHAVMVSKKPDDVFEIDRVRNFYAGRRAGVRFVVMVRDPRDVLTSRHEVTGPGVYFEEIGAWRRCHEAVRRQMGREDVMVVYYRDLVTETAAVRRRVEAFTGVASERGWGNFHEGEMGDFDTRPLNGVRPVDRASVGRWAREEHRERIEQVLREVPDFAEILVEMGWEGDDSWIARWRERGRWVRWAGAAGARSA